MKYLLLDLGSHLVFKARCSPIPGCRCRCQATPENPPPCNHQHNAQDCENKRKTCEPWSRFKAVQRKFPQENLFQLVGGFNPSEKYESVGMMIPNIWKNMKKCSKPPTSQAFDGNFEPFFLCIQFLPPNGMASLPGSPAAPCKRHRKCRNKGTMGPHKCFFYYYHFYVCLFP